MSVVALITLLANSIPLVSMIASDSDSFDLPRSESCQVRGSFQLGLNELEKLLIDRIGGVCIYGSQRVIAEP